MQETVNELRRIVGEQYVSDNPEERFIYSRDPGTMEPRDPDIAVMPATTEEVRKIMLLASDLVKAHEGLKEGSASQAELAIAIVNIAAAWSKNPDH